MIDGFELEVDFIGTPNISGTPNYNYMFENSFKGNSILILNYNKENESIVDEIINQIQNSNIRKGTLIPDNA